MKNIYNRSLLNYPNKLIRIYHISNLVLFIRYCKMPKVKPLRRKKEWLEYIVSYYSTRNSNPPVLFHRFPHNDKKRLKQWIQQCKRSKLPEKRTAVCSAHICDKDYHSKIVFDSNGVAWPRWWKQTTWWKIQFQQF